MILGFFLCLYPGLMESMRAADLNNLSLNPDQFADLASSLNQFFTQTGFLNNSTTSQNSSHTFQHSHTTSGEMRGEVGENGLGWWGIEGLGVDWKVGERQVDSTRHGKTLGGRGGEREDRGFIREWEKRKLTR